MLCPRELATKYGRRVQTWQQGGSARCGHGASFISRHLAAIKPFLQHMLDLASSSLTGHGDRVMQINLCFLTYAVTQVNLRVMCKTRAYLLDLLGIQAISK